MNPEIREMAAGRLEEFSDTVSQYRSWFMILGVALIVLGIIAVIFPLATTIAVKVFLGWIILIGGLAVGSPGKGRFLIRGVGPALKAFGVTSALDDPRLKVFSGRDLIESNDDWNEGPESAGLPAAFAAVGAFAFTDGSKDAALMLTLAPGTYTIQLEGVDDATGTALVEIYRLE